LKATIRQVLQTISEHFGASVFTNPKQFKSALEDAPINSGDGDTVRNLLRIAVCEMQAYSRLKMALAGGNFFAIDNLPGEMSSKYMMDKAAAQVVIECIAELLGHKPASVSAPSPQKKTQAPQAGAPQGSHPAAAAPGVEPMMKRGRLSLESSEWGPAVGFFDRALDIDPDYAPAYAGLLCAELNVALEVDLASCGKLFADMPNYKKALRFADAGYRAALEGYEQKNRRHVAEQDRRLFVRVEGGTFQMGAPSGGYDDERPVRSVTVGSFHMGKHPLTQREWRDVMGANPSHFKGDSLPVESVSWFEAVEYANRRSKKEGLTPAYSESGGSVTWNRGANGYRLPTEAEWEYAARGGKMSRNYEYSGSNNAGEVAWYCDNSGSKTHAVGQKEANELGLHDMSGNVWEWCWDWYGAYPSKAETDPVGAPSGSARVARGGGWGSNAGIVRCADRSRSDPSGRNKNVGFRLVLP